MKSIAADAPNRGFFKRIRELENSANGAVKDAPDDQHFNWFQQSHNFTIYKNPSQQGKEWL